MTAQITDKIFWNCKEYELLSFDSLGGKADLFSPKKYGIAAEMISTGCYRGFYCKYKVSQDNLILDSLTVRASDGIYPPINKVTAEQQKTSVGHYSQINLAILFSGTIRIAADFDSKQYRHMGFQETTAYGSVFDIVFVDGTVTRVVDLSKDVLMMRETQAAVDDFVSKNWLPQSWLDKLKAEYGHIRGNDVRDDFDQRIRRLHYQKPLLLIQEVMSLQESLSWFIANHFDYYQRAHRYAHTFSDLKYLGIPASLLTFLEAKTSENISEEKVTFSLLKALLDTKAKGQWGGSLPIIFDRKLLKEEIDPFLVSSVREKLKSWPSGV